MPFRGAVLMWHLGRVVSIILGAGVIVVTFFTVLEIFSGDYWLAVVAAAIIAFVPTFVLISSSVSYEPLVGLMVGLYFWQLVRIVKGDNRLRNYLGLGILLGLSITAKYAALVLPLEAVVVLTVLAWKRAWRWNVWLGRIGLVALAVLLATVWWFIFLFINFNQITELGLVTGLLQPIIAGGGDTTQNYIAHVLTGGEIGAIQSFEIVSEPFWAWILQIYQTFWIEEIGGHTIGPVAHVLIAGAGVISLVGLVRACRNQPEKRMWIALLLFHIALFLVFPLVRFMIQGRLAQTAQGRHVLFPVATALPLLLAFGWQAWLSPKVQRWLAMAVIGVLLSWSLVQLVVTAAFYAPLHLPVRTTGNELARIEHRLNAAFGHNLYLVGYDTQLLTDESSLKLSLYWHSPSYADEDYRITVNLIRDGSSYLEISAYPTNGRYPTRVWESWETIRDDLWFPLANLPAGDYEIQLQVAGVGGPLPVEGADGIVLGRFAVPDTRREIRPDIPLSLTVEGREVVAGLKLWQAERYRTINLPEFRPRMIVPFVWMGQPGQDERIEWLLVDGNGQVYPAQKASTRFEYFTVGPDWSAGDYRIRAEVWRDDAVLASLETQPLITVINKRPRLLQVPNISHPLAANFDNKVNLIGYDLPVRRLSTGEGVPLTLYWQGLRTMGQSYTVFTKLIDSRHQVWGSAERLPADGYNTFYWLENEVVIDSFELPAAPAIPDGVYWLNIGLYEEIDRAAVSLPLVIDDQPSGTTSVTVGPLKFGGPPADSVDTGARPEHMVNEPFGGIINLLGYDELVRNDNALALKLYWESVAPADADYVVFVHVRDRDGRTVTQMDRPPADYAYPTSLWEPGEIIPDEVGVPWPADLPPGDYSIILGLYDLNTGRRLPVAGTTADSYLLPSIVVD
jgi:hypothetical protein